MDEISTYRRELSFYGREALFSGREKSLMDEKCRYGRKMSFF
jgi:hypothetical protein